MLVTTGGASVGEYDLVQRALAAEGMALSFWKIAMRPGRPMMHGRLGAMHVLGLPGNPVSSYVCAILFLVPLLRRLAGRATCSSCDRTGGARPRPAGNDERADYLRATLSADPHGRLVATPFPSPGQFACWRCSPRPTACSSARSHAPAAAAGNACRIIRLRHPPDLRPCASRCSPPN